MNPLSPANRQIIDDIFGTVTLACGPATFDEAEVEILMNAARAEAQRAPAEREAQ